MYLLVWREKISSHLLQGVDIHPLYHLQGRDYNKVLKFSDARKLGCNLPKIKTKRPERGVFYQNDANRIADSEDPDQTAALGSGSALFAQFYLSENLGSLRYTCNYKNLS